MNGKEKGAIKFSYEGFDILDTDVWKAPTVMVTVRFWKKWGNKPCRYFGGRALKAEGTKKCKDLDVEIFLVCSDKRDETWMEWIIPV